MLNRLGHTKKYVCVLESFLKSIYEGGDEKWEINMALYVIRRSIYCYFRSIYEVQRNAYYKTQAVETYTCRKARISKKKFIRWLWALASKLFTHSVLYHTACIAEVKTFVVEQH